LTAYRAVGVGALVVGLATSAVAALLTTLMGAVILPPLLAPLQAQGMPPPSLTGAFAAAYPLAWLGPLAVLLVWRFGGVHGRWLAGLVGMASMLVVGGIAVVAMYLALFAQASAI
jgi:hypothetical protein